MRLTPWLVLAIACSACAPAPGPIVEWPPARDLAYIAHASGTISVLDPAGRVLTVLGGRLRGIATERATIRHLAVTRDGARAFAPSREQDLVYVIDLHAGRTEASIAVKAAPEEVVLAADGRRAFVTSERPALVVIDVARLEVAREIEVGGATGGFGGRGTIVLAPHGRTIVALTADASIAVVDTASERLTGRIPLTGAPASLAVTPDGSGVWVAGFPPGAVTLVDLGSGEILDAVAVGGRPRGLAITPNGRWLYVAEPETAAVAVVDVAAGAVGKRVRLSSPADALAVSRDGRFVLALQTEGHAVTVINTATQSVAYEMKAGTLRPWPAAITVP